MSPNQSTPGGEQRGDGGGAPGGNVLRDQPAAGQPAGPSGPVAGVPWHFQRPKLVLVMQLGQLMLYWAILIPLFLFYGMEPEFWVWAVVIVTAATVLQWLYLQPVLRPSAIGGHVRPWWVWCSAVIAGLVCGALAAAVLTMSVDLAWLLGLKQEPGADGAQLAALVLLGVVWLIATPLVVAFLRKDRIEHRLGRLASAVFLGTLVEFLAGIPLYEMVRRREPCISGTGTFWSVWFAGFLGFFLLGPVVVLLIIRRRSRAADRGHCAACGYDLRGLASRERCPECGAGWATRPTAQS